MAEKRQHSKYAIDQQLFKPEPPIEPRQVKRLFHGREREFLRGFEGLKSGIDIGGKRSRKDDKWPWVIHGESRSGKSHLARRIFAALPDTDLRPQFRIVAGGRLNAINVMRELFEEMRGRFLNRILDQRLTDDPLRFVDVQIAKQLVEEVGLFQSGVTSVTLSVEHSSTDTGDIGLELGGGTKLAKFVAKFQSQRAEKNAVNLTLRPPTPADLAEVCGIMAETLLRRKLIRHILILMDDVDLLEGYVSPDQNARAERSLLAEAIRILHDTAGMDLVVTARSWYYHAQKELQTLVDLAMANPIPVADMLGIHDQRWEVFAEKLSADGFLSRDALREAEGNSN